MKVLLVSTNQLRFPYPIYPIGLDHVVGALAPGHEIRILDLCPLYTESEGAAIVDTARGFAPDAIGISIRNADSADSTQPLSFLDDLRRTVQCLRAVTSAPIVLGGAGYALFPAQILKAAAADFGFVGEGELCRPLFDALARGQSPAGLPGVMSPGQPVPAPARISCRGLPSRATPESNPALSWYLSHGGVLNLQTQRGCPFTCVYCSYPTIEGPGLRPFDTRGVAHLARQLEATGARFLSLTDSVFNADPAHALQVAAALRKEGLRIPWSAYFAPFAPSDGFYQRMAEGGCTHVEFGTESLCDAMLLRLGKRFHRLDVLAAHEAARAAGLHVAHFFLLGGPDETVETVDDTLTAADSLEGAPLFFFCGMRIYPGTPLEQLAQQIGQVRDGDDLLAPRYYQPPAFPLPELAAYLEHRAAPRPHWIVGAGAVRTAKLVARLHERGHVGPLWDKLVA